MADINLPPVTDPTMDLDHVNDPRTALNGDFIGRDNLGATAAGQNLGTAAVPWGIFHTDIVTVGGQVIDFSLITAGNSNNSVVSGATRTGSQQPDFIRASGSAATADILATTTPLIYTANGTSATVSADVTLSGLTVAPSTDNTCLIDDTAYAGGDSTKYEGEGTGTITIDAAGSEITDRIGQYVVLKGTTEYMLAFVESATTLRNCFRGYFFDDAGDPVVREALTNNDTLTLMSLGWVFAQNNASTFDVSYRSPYIQHTEPSAGVTDDYWFDMGNGYWTRYNGTNWIEIDRTLIGLLVMDGTNCVSSRSIDFSKAFNDFIDLEVTLKSVTEVRSSAAHSAIAVYGEIKEWMGAPVTWDIAADLESGLIEAISTLYYLYVTENGETIISDERPYDRRPDLKGFYHPYHSWRYVGICYNDGSSDLTSANSKNNNQPRVDIFNVSGEYLPLPNIDSVKVTIGGGGGGGGGVDTGAGGNGGNGGTSSFGSYASAGGGIGGLGGGSISKGGDGGTGSGGDYSIIGGAGYHSQLITTTAFGGHGGGAYLSQGGAGAYSTGAAVNGGGGGACGGGGGACGGGSLVGAAGSGGGGGDTEIISISNVSSRVSVTIGAGGAFGNGNVRDGGAGGAGIVLVEY